MSTVKKKKLKRYNYLTLHCTNTHDSLTKKGKKIVMPPFKLTKDLTEGDVLVYLRKIENISALYASKLFQELGIYNLMNRARTPEEIFHFNNYLHLEKEFSLIFHLLANKGFIHKQGEFYSVNQDRELVIDRLENEIEKNEELFKPLIDFFERLIPKYKTILKGEQGKLCLKEYSANLDSLIGTRLFVNIHQFCLERLILKTSLPDQISILNWGVGSGYDAIVLANILQERASIVSIEPTMALDRCQVLQDLYQQYNIKFIAQESFRMEEHNKKFDLISGFGLLWLNDFNNKIQISKNLTHNDSLLLSIESTELHIGLGWILSIFENFPFEITQNNLRIKFRKQGFSLNSILGLKEKLLLLEKDS